MRANIDVQSALDCTWTSVTRVHSEASSSAIKISASLGHTGYPYIVYQKSILEFAAKKALAGSHITRVPLTIVST